MPAEKTWEKELEKLHARESEAQQGGGQARLQKLREKGILTARERIDYILDAGSFVELNMLAEHQCHDFEMDKKKFAGDGVVTGYGTIAGRKVFIYSEDVTVLGGSTGKTHGAKIHYILKLARENMVPVICLNASAGARIQEGMDNVYGITGMFYQNSLNSGVVPQIAAIMGACTGGAAYSAALCDFIVQVEKTSYVFITGPAVIKEVTGEEVSFEELGGAKVHSTKSGVVHLSARDDRHCLDLIKDLLNFLPQNNREKPARKPCADSNEREVPELIDMVPIQMSKTYDMKQVIRTIVDEGDFFEIHAVFAMNMVVGFAHMGGQVVGLVANNPRFMVGCLDIDSSDKAARFVRFCDSFNIPILTFVDVPGFLPGTGQEHGGIIRHGAKLLFAYCEATVPKLTVVTRKAYGGAYDVMSSKHIRGDVNLAWPTAEIAVMGPEGAVNIIFRKELAQSEDVEKRRAELVAEYREKFANPYIAASRGFIDDVIEPRETRPRLVNALEMIANKRDVNPAKKHGNIPL